MKKIFTFLILAMQGISGNAQLCTLQDPTFGNRGIATGLSVNGTNRPPGSNNILVQTDGKIIQPAGIYSGTKYEFGVIRYTANGLLDSAFGTNGRVTTSVGDADDYDGTGALQVDGKIVVAGSAIVSGKWNFALLRYNSNGSLDSSFGSLGKMTTHVGQYDDHAIGLTIQPDGKIVVVGSSGDSLNVRAFAIVRYLANGNLDSSFGQNGKIVPHIGPFITHIGTYIGDVYLYYGRYFYEYAHSVTVQPDGKIIVAGQSYVQSGCYDDYGGLSCNPAFAMARYYNNGSLDTSFGKNGKVVDSILLLSPTSAAMQADGKIVVTGTGNSGGGFIIKRYNSNGSQDSSFGGAGYVITRAGGSSGGSAYSGSLYIQPDGKIILGGAFQHSNSSDFAVIRYKPDGIPDSSLYGNGIAVFHLCQPGSVYMVSGVALQGNKIIAGGKSQDAGSSRIISVRLHKAVSPLLPVITAGGPLIFCDGGNVRLSSGEQGDIQQWYKNNAVIPGAVDTIYTASGGGSYVVNVINSSGCGISAPVVVTVNNNPPKPPILWTSDYHFITTSGYAHYQWLLNGLPITGNDSNNYKPKPHQVGLYKVSVTDINGCNNISDSFVLNVTSVTDITLGDTKLRYYPNPVKAVLNIDINNSGYNKLEAELFDLNGRLMNKQALSQNHNQLSLQHLPSGFYQLVINNGIKRITVKVMLIK